MLDMSKCWAHFEDGLQKAILAHQEKIYNPLTPKPHINQELFLIYPALLQPVPVKLHYSNITHQSNFLQGEYSKMGVWNYVWSFNMSIC